jgi:hypothetical protein
VAGGLQASRADYCTHINAIEWTIMAGVANNDDLNELLGSDSDNGVGEEKSNELNELLGDSDEDESPSSEMPGKKSSQTTIDEFYAGASAADGQVDELEQILGKADAKGAGKLQKSKTQSRIAMQTTYHVPNSHTTLFVRTPNFLKIQTTEYDQSLYEADSERKFLDGSTAVVRWRLKRDERGEVVADADGKHVKESNARVLRWADGSVQLVVGDAVFQCKSLGVDNWQVLCFLVGCSRVTFPRFSQLHLRAEARTQYSVGAGRDGDE